MAEPKITTELRPAGDGDRAFLWEVHRTALRPPVEATWGWDEAVQKRHFDEHFDTSGVSIVVIDGADAGYVCLLPRDDHLFLSNIALLLRHQGKGLGTRLIRMVLAQGLWKRLPVRLQVLKTNRARALYERLGFSQSGETETHFLMEWRKGPEGAKP